MRDGPASSVEAEAVRSRRRQFSRGGGSSVEAEGRPGGVPDPPGNPRRPRTLGPKHRAQGRGQVYPREVATPVRYVAVFRRPSLRRAPRHRHPREARVRGRRGSGQSEKGLASRRPGVPPQSTQARATPPSTRPEPPRHQPGQGHPATCSRAPRLPNDRIGRQRCSPPTYRAVVRARVTGPTSGYSTLTFTAPDLSNDEQSW